jgi:hypothetical protein
MIRKPIKYSFRRRSPCCCYRLYVCKRIVVAKVLPSVLFLSVKKETRALDTHRVARGVVLRYVLSVVTEMVHPTPNLFCVALNCHGFIIETKEHPILHIQPSERP